MSTSTSDTMAPRSGRATFVPVREVIARARSALQAAEAAVARAPRGDDPRTELLRQSLGSLQRDLAVSLERFAEAAPSSTLEEQTQYAVEMPRELERDAPPGSLDDALAWSRSLLATLRGRFRDLAEAAVSRSLHDAWTSLSELVAGYEKRVANITRAAEQDF